MEIGNRKGTDDCFLYVTCVMNMLKADLERLENVVVDEGGLWCVTSTERY
jgi:hypothetical protein